MLHATKGYLIRKSVHRKTEDDILVQIHIESSYHDVHKGDFPALGLEFQGFVVINS